MTVEEVENTVLGTEDKVEELDQKVKHHKRMLRKYKHAGYLGNLTYNLWVKKKERRYKLKSLTTYSIE
jgi:hypothetical protein